MSKHTILHTIETGGPGGAETVLLELATKIDSGRFRSLALLPGGSWLPQELKEHGVPTVIARSHAWHDLHLPKVMTRLVREERVDLIHSHLPDQNFYSCLVARWTGCRTIVTFHGVPELSRNRGVSGAIKPWVVRRTAAQAVVVSDYLNRALRETGWPSDKIVRIYNGVEVERFGRAKPGSLRRELGIEPESKLIGMIANLRDSKGYEHFVQSARAVVDAVPNAKFVAVGEKEERIAARLEHLVEGLGLKHHFFFLGFRADVPEILADLDVFVLSSITEGLSIATIEAMAAGKPVVVTRSGGPEEIVEDGRTGVLAATGDAADLAAKICEVLQDRSLAEALARNAQAVARSKFSVPGMIAEYEALYERVLNAN